MTKDMTQGSPLKLLLAFAVPLMLGSLFQQFYNLADTIIVGRFVGVEALAAVGSVGGLNYLVLGFVNGIACGFSIPISWTFGAHDDHEMRRYTANTVWLSIAFATVLTIVTVAMTRLVLVWTNTPADIIDLADIYIRTIFAGIPFTLLYNVTSALMRALGDSKSALYFLMISSVLNIGGDLFFVQVLNWGSNGCALSTVVSEALCCVLCVLYIRWKVPILQLGRRWLVFDGKLLRKTVSYGWTSAMQQATVQLGKIAVQAIVNTMGVNAMAAFTAASRIDDFAYTPQQNIGHAMTTLMAQNRGAGKHDRVKQGFHCGMRIEFVYALLLTGVCLLFAEPIIRLFATDPAVVDLGVRFLRTISLFYLMPAATNGIQGFFRGMGDLKVTLNSSMLNMGGRVAAAALFVLVMKMDIEALPFSYAVGWLLMLLYELPLLVRFLRSSEM